jgi:hypothetical protein
MARTKYNAQSCTDADGNVFDSRGECGRYADLKLRERAGLISHLLLKPPKIVLVAKDRDAREIAWSVDYSYDDVELERFVYEDYKPRPLARYEHLLIKLWEHFGPAPLRISGKKGGRFTLLKHIEPTVRHDQE